VFRGWPNLEIYPNIARKSQKQISMVYTVVGNVEVMVQQ
jgi:hypothetical protein